MRRIPHRWAETGVTTGIFVERVSHVERMPEDVPRGHEIVIWDDCQPRRGFMEDVVVDYDSDPGHAEDFC